MSVPGSKNIILIGMPGAGKSTVGVILAKMTAMDYVDTDLLLQTSRGCSLQDIVDKQGYMELRRIEEEVLLGLRLKRHVIATGGSAVYSDAAMAHLRSSGVVVFLDVSLETLEARIRDFASRGLARRPGQTFAELYRERSQLYTRYADIRLQGDGLTQEAVCERILEAVERRKDGVL